MQTSDFDFELPKYLIAQTPLEKRDESKLLVLDKNSGEIKHDNFFNIIDYLNKDDVLVLNDTKVIPARLIGVKEETKAIIEILLLKETNNNQYECLVKPAKRISVGTIVKFSDKLQAKCVLKKEEGLMIFELIYEGFLYEILDELGSMPLPPYIYEKLINKDRYQTVYAKNIGSAAAPTAGLHFTKELLGKIEQSGVKIVYITLHVGLGTFRPINVEDITQHQMHEEFYQISETTANTLNETIKNNQRIIAVGTTTTRTLETVMQKYGAFKEDSGFTNIFIYPGFKFKAVNSIITNFHLPKSTLIMLVSAFASKEFVLNSYQEAILKEYRFFSFGDAMLIR